MALRAVVREVQRHVVRGTLEVGIVTGETILRQAVKSPPGMAIATGDPRMSARQREERMVDQCRSPAVPGMALRTVMREIQVGMAGRTLIVGIVAGEAVLRQTREVTRRCMALDAVQTAMPAVERKELVDDIRAAPAHRVMALLAVGDPSIGDVIRIADLDRIFPVAVIALQRRPSEIAGGGPVVATFAVCYGMRTHQGETGTGMLADQARRVPARLAVAAQAIKSQRRGMRVNVATRAPTCHIGLNWPAIIVAPQTGRLRMDSLQRVSRLLFVIKLKVVAKRVPAVRQMADAAVSGKVLMRNKRTPFALVPLLARDHKAASNNDEIDEQYDPNQTLKHEPMVF